MSRACSKRTSLRIHFMVSTLLIVMALPIRQASAHALTRPSMAAETICGYVLSLNSGAEWGVQPWGAEFDYFGILNSDFQPNGLVGGMFYRFYNAQYVDGDFYSTDYGHIRTGIRASRWEQVPDGEACKRVEVQPTVRPGPKTQVSYKEFSFSYDPVIAKGIRAEIVPAQLQPEFGWGNPEYTNFSFQGYHIGGIGIWPPEISIYPVREYERINADRESGPKQEVDCLKSLLQERPDLATADCVPFVPYVNAGTPIGFKAPKSKYLSFANGAGVRYIAYFAQDISTIQNGNIFYTFQGLSNDGNYYIAAYFPLSVPVLPATPPISDFNDPSYDSDADLRAVEAFFQGLAGKLEGLDNSQYTPSLDLLDELITTLSTDPAAVAPPSLTPTPKPHTPIPPTPTNIPPTLTPVPKPENKLPPVIMVHGWLGADTCLGSTYKPFKPGVDTVQDIKADPQKNGFGELGLDMLRWSEKQGFSVYFARLDTSACYTPRVQDNVANLKLAIDRAKQDTKQNKVILVTHSMAGLVARAYIEARSEDGIGPYQNDVAALFTYGTPHLGVTMSTRFFRLQAAQVYRIVGKELIDYQNVMEDFYCAPECQDTFWAKLR